MSKAYTTLTRRPSLAQRAAVPQTRPIPGREKEMVVNNAGGFTFEVNPVQRLQRFLVLGSDGGTYYATERDHTKTNYDNVSKVIKMLGTVAVDIIKAAAASNLAPRRSPLLLALAMCMDPEISDQATRREAAAAVKDIVSTNSHMLEFVSYVRMFRGGGRLFKQAIGEWYNDMPAGKLAYQLVKYQNRSGYTTRDVLRLARPTPVDVAHGALFGWATKYGYSPDYVSEVNNDLMDAYAALQRLAAQDTQSTKLISAAVNAIADFGLTHEMLPTGVLKSPEVWHALLRKMPMTAMIRNLGRMSSYGVTNSLEARNTILERLGSKEYLTKSHIHPMAVLLALTTYSSSGGYRSKLVWTPDKDIVHMLDKAFYNTWHNVVPAGKRTLIALDVSYSMTQPIMNTNLPCRTAAMAMAMMTEATEPNCEVWGFSRQFRQLKVSSRATLEDNVKVVNGMEFASTDCSLPFVKMLEKRKEFDTFVVYTDNETYAGAIHPSVAMDRYGQVMNLAPKCVVVGMTSTNFTIADPARGDMLDVVGFDASAPAMISSFSRGDF
jgi:60 kDa SS-A/Ro ribonucleoprotein